jgi:hypothetical protein
MVSQLFLAIESNNPQAQLDTLIKLPFDEMLAACTSLAPKRLRNILRLLQAQNRTQPFIDTLSFLPSSKTSNT